MVGTASKAILSSLPPASPSSNPSLKRSEDAVSGGPNKAPVTSTSTRTSASKVSSRRMPSSYGASRRRRSTSTGSPCTQRRTVRRILSTQASCLRPRRLVGRAGHTSRTTATAFSRRTVSLWPMNRARTDQYLLPPDGQLFKPVLASCRVSRSRHGVPMHGTGSLSLSTWLGSLWYTNLLARYLWRREVSRS